MTGELDWARWRYHHFYWWKLDRVGLEHEFYFSIGNNNPNWRTHIFQRGRLNHQPLIVNSCSLTMFTAFIHRLKTASSTFLDPPSNHKIEVIYGNIPDTIRYLRLYLYGGLGWWFGSLGNQSYVQNRFEKCVVFFCVFCICFIFCLTNLI